MGLARGIARPLLLLALVAVILSGNGADAFFGNLIQNMFQKVEEIVNKVDDIVTETVKKFSVLSGVFGDGMTRADLSLPEIINGAFSRNNPIFIVSGPDGNGSNYVGAVSTGGSVSVTSSADGNVSIMTNDNPGEGAEESEGTTGEQNEGQGEEQDMGQEVGQEVGQDIGQEEGQGEEAGEVEQEVDAGGVNGNETIAGSGSAEDAEFFSLMEDWDAFVTSSIWEMTEEEEPMPSAEEEMELGAETRVINGVHFGNGVPAGAPFAVKFFFNNEQNFYCSGSLIGYSYVLTAAHCGVVVGDTVRVGGIYVRTGYKAEVAEVLLHPDFEAGSLAHDVAVVRLVGLPDKRTLKKNGVKPARLNKEKDFPEEGFVGVVSGHGSTVTDGSGAAPNLQSTRHTVYELEKCKQEITQGKLGDEESYLCMGNGDRSTTCVGDSGAGLWRYRVKKTRGGRKRKFFELFGLVSFGEVTDEALCPLGPPTVFQRTSSSFKWIVSVVGEENMP